jgi:hypothetical protein
LESVDGLVGPAADGSRSGRHGQTDRGGCQNTGTATVMAIFFMIKTFRR